MNASKDLVQFAGGAWEASINHFDSGDRGAVTTLQVDEHVYVVGSDGFDIAHYSLAGWLGEVEQAAPPAITCDDAATAWDTLRFLREDCFVWQCGACDAWIFTSNRPRIGVLRCSTCGDGGVDFRHADRHVGGDEEH